MPNHLQRHDMCSTGRTPSDNMPWRVLTTALLRHIELAWQLGPPTAPIQAFSKGALKASQCTALTTLHSVT